MDWYREIHRQTDRSTDPIDPTDPIDKIRHIEIQKDRTIERQNDRFDLIDRLIDRLDGWMDGWIGRQVDGIGGWKDRWIHISIDLHLYFFLYYTC